MPDPNRRVVNKEGPSWAVRDGKGLPLLAAVRTQQEAIELARKQLAEDSGGTLEVYTEAGALKTQITVEPLKKRVSEEVTTAAPTFASKIGPFLHKHLKLTSLAVLGVLFVVLEDDVVKPFWQNLIEPFTHSGEAVLVKNLTVEPQYGGISMALPAEMKVTVKRCTGMETRVGSIPRAQQL